MRLLLLKANSFNDNWEVAICKKKDAEGKKSVESILVYFYHLWFEILGATSRLIFEIYVNRWFTKDSVCVKR